MLLARRRRTPPSVPSLEARVVTSAADSDVEPTAHDHSATSNGVVTVERGGLERPQPREVIRG